MAKGASTSPHPSKRRLSQAAEARIKFLPKDVKALATKVEQGDLSLVQFVQTMIVKTAEPTCSPKGVMQADSALTYLRRRNIETATIIELFERHANVVYMRANGGTFRRDTRFDAHLRAGPAPDDGRLLSELLEQLGPKEGSGPSGRGRTLYDKSTTQQTMRAGKYAK